MNDKRDFNSDRRDYGYSSNAYGGGINGDFMNRKRKAEKRKKILYIVLVCLLAAALIGVSIGLGIMVMKYKEKESEANQMEAIYQKAYYELISSTNDMSSKLSKLSVSSSGSKQQEMLYDLWKNAELAEQSLSTLNVEGDGGISLKKFINQLGDYAHYLTTKTVNGGALSKEDKETLAKLESVMLEMSNSLKKVHEEVMNGKLFIGDGNLFEGSLGDMFEKFSDGSIELPTLIYDGPFSDGLKDRETKALNGKSDIDEQTGREIAAKLFNVDASQLTYEGEWNTDIPTLNYSFIDENGIQVHMQLSKKGGMLISMNRYNQNDGGDIDDSECADEAEKYIKLLGFNNMQTVWASSEEGICYVNLAPVKDGVILYPDLIKVKISKKDKTLLGVDARNYAFNHTERTFANKALSVEEAQSRLDSSLVVENVREAIIPYRTSGEKYTYEFYCTSERGIYFVYIDVTNGDEVNILYVVDADGTELLM